MNEYIKVYLLLAMKGEDGEIIGAEPKVSKIPLSDIHSFYDVSVEDEERTQVNFYSSESCVALITFDELDRLKTAYDKSLDSFKIQSKYN
jgi:hypothetical protein